MPSSRVAVIGSGAWGTTLAILAARAGTSATLFVRDPQTADEIRSTRVNERRLPGVQIPPGVRISSDIAEALSDAGVVILAVPSQTMRANAAAIRNFLGSAVVASAAKGLERGSLRRMSQVLAEELPSAPICAISGPNLAREIAAGKPATTVIAGADPVVSERVRSALMSAQFRCYAHDDIVGVEMGGALKNIVAIGAGMADGLGAGDNAKAAFITRGIAEIARLGVAAGADPLTFAGLSGIGDLVATCASTLSRNHRVGEQLAQGRSVAEIRAGMSDVAEGIDTTAAARELGNRLDIELPITEQLYRVLFEGIPALEAINALMSREATTELGALRTVLADRQEPDAVN
jgi:glycerol-3-phosphate dehydrogenase (NAD(P)+)